jgi:hypothetical protein
MLHNKTFFKGLSEVGGAVGRGLIAGFAGTVAITISQMIEMKITNRSMSEAPSKVGGKALGVEPRGKAALEKEKTVSENDEVPDEIKREVEANKEKFTQLMHFGYGTSWGVFRGGLDLAGLYGPFADFLHFGAIWGTAQVMLPANDAAEPITKWSPKQIVIDIIHHAVYACATGLTYDAMRKAEIGTKNNLRPNSWLKSILAGN